MTEQTAAFRPSGSIEFEAIDPQSLVRPASAPQPKDDPIDRDPLSINFGRLKDARPMQAERMLSGAAIDWFVAFPATARPKALCDRYPHVANRLAALWSQAAEARGALEALATDPRWGSAGFPAQVQGELQALTAQLAR